MKWIVTWTTRHPVFSNLLMVVLLLGGIWAGNNLRREKFPELSLDMIRVSVPYPFATPEEVEESICKQIEREIEGLDGIKKVNSVASENIGTVLLELDASADSSEVLAEVRNKIDGISTFPEDAEEPRVAELFRRNRVISLVLYGQCSERSLKEITREIKDELLLLPGVTQVQWGGVREYEISIEISEATLQEHKWSFAQVVDAVKKSSLNLPGGTLRTPQEEIKLQTSNRKYTGKEYREIILESNRNGASIKLGDVARVVDGFEEDDRLGFFNGHPAMQITVYKTAEQDALKISKTVKKYFAVKKDNLPEGLTLEIWSDDAKIIRERLDMLLRNGVYGIILVLFSLWLFLNLRLSFWVALGIPISFGGGLLILWSCDQSLNMISMFAMIMTLGLVVDDAIVIGENIYTHQQKGERRMPAAVDGALEMAPPVTAAVITTIIAFSPMFFVTGIMGKFIINIPTAVCSILIFSLVESLFILPSHLAHGRQAKKTDNTLFHKIRGLLDKAIHFSIYQIYQPLYHKALKHKSFIIAISIAMLLMIGGLFRGGQVSFIFFPKLDEEIIVANVRFPQGTPLSTTKAAIEQMEAGAKKIKDKFPNETKIVRRIYSVVGENASDFSRSSGSHIGEVILELTASGERGVKSPMVVNAWRESVGEIPGALSVTFGGQRHGPGGKPIEIALLAKDYDILRTVAGELKKELANFSDVYDIEDDYQPGKLEITPVLNARGHSLGVKERDIGRQLFQGFAGEEILRLQRGADEVKVRVRYLKENRNSLKGLEDMYVRTASGEVPLTKIADLTMHRGPAQINRQDKLRRLRVIADINQEKTPAGQVIQHLQQKTLPELQKKYQGFSYSFEGQQQEKRNSIRSLMIGFVFAMIGIFGVLALVFHSYFQPIIIMTVIPFGCIGAILGHWLLGQNLAIMSIFGIVALTGVVVNDSLVFIDRINVGLRQGKTVEESVKEAGPNRFRAIMLTSLTTFAGLTPILLEKSFQAQFVIPMAISLGFGLIFATVITLFMVPCLFLYLNTFRQILHWIKTGIWPNPEEVEPAYAKMDD